MRRISVSLLAFFFGFWLAIWAGLTFAATKAEALASCTAYAHSQSCSGYVPPPVDAYTNYASCYDKAPASYAYGIVAGSGNNQCNGGNFPYVYEPSRCAALAGKPVSLEFFVGWTTSPSIDSTVANPTWPALSLSVSGCEATQTSVDRCYVYASNMSKGFCEYTYTYTGADGTSPAATNGAPDGACPAGKVYGLVNGKGGCYTAGTPSSGVAPTVGTVVDGGAPTSGVSPTSAVAPTESSWSSSSSGGGGGGGGTPAQVQQSLDNQAATNTKLDEIKAGACGGTGQPACKQDQTFTSPGAGTMPTHSGSWYTSKYPGGLHAVWDTRKAQLMSSPLGSALTGMALPEGSGSVPVWHLSLWQLGTYDVSLPAWLWATMRAIILLSAAFACRRIIFGG